MSYSEELQQEALENLNMIRNNIGKPEFILDAPYPNPNDLKDPGNRNTFNHFMFYYNKYKDDPDQLNQFFQDLYDIWSQRPSMPLYHILNAFDTREATDSEASDIDGGKRNAKKRKSIRRKTKKRLTKKRKPNKRY